MGGVEWKDLFGFIGQQNRNLTAGPAGPLRSFCVPLANPFFSFLFCALNANFVALTSY